MTSLRKRLTPLSIKTYAMVFIGVVVLMFGAINWAMLSEIGATRSDMERRSLQAAEEEISQALVQLNKELFQVGYMLTGWDETRQQLGDVSYYTYWRDNRVLDGGGMPAYVKAAELYNRRGEPLANSPLPGMPKRLSGEQRPTVQRHGGLDYLFLFLAVPEGGDESQISGYAVIKVDVLAALRNVQHFRHADPRSVGLLLREGGSVGLDEIRKYVVFSLAPNQEMAALLQAMTQSQYQMALIVLFMSGVLYFALSRLLAKPLRRLSQHIDMLREGSGKLQLDSPAGVMPVMELEKVRVSLNDYQSRLEAMHASLDQKNTELWTMAHRDPLTGIFNRRCFEEDWQLVLSVAAGHRVGVSFLLFDCDHFKPINDTYGHDAGDQVIQAIALELQQTLCAGDRLYRLGGDEFATIFLDAEPGDALNVAQRCVEAVDLHDFSALAIREPIRISVGIAHASGTRPEDLATLQKQADVAMYHAKRPGHGKMAVYSEEMASNGNALFSNQATNAVFAAISTGAPLEMHYQPVVELATREVVYYEALVRIRTEHALIFPGEIFPVVESRRLEAEFDFVVIGRVLENLAAGAIPRGSGVSINISGPAIVHPRIKEKMAPLEPYLKEYRLVLEITETALITQLQVASANLNQLRAAGFQVALDDFGSGYSSLGYLANMPVDVVKFDISLIRSLEQGDRHGGIVEGLALMIRKAGYSVVAEGIESEKTLETVSRLGFTHGQGYLLGRPSAR